MSRVSSGMRKGSTASVSWYHVRSFQMSRMVFGLTPNTSAISHADTLLFAPVDFDRMTKMSSTCCFDSTAHDDLLVDIRVVPVQRACFYSPRNSAVSAETRRKKDLFP
mmetsp:Transcript_29166/g.76546  ORF Transcript_29166/g.76546 Transcript_29166/m.76546 type:complete len:108 (-) Transcript_29166:76-399(-)